MNASAGVLRLQTPFLQHRHDTFICHTKYYDLNMYVLLYLSNYSMTSSFFDLV